MENEINPPLQFDELQENTFRERAIMRLLTDHSDMDEVRLESWLAMLNDVEPGARVMAATAVWTMMEVRDNHKHRNQISS